MDPHYHRSTTYTLRFLRNRQILDAEIHQSLESVGESAVNYVMAFGSERAYVDLEMLLLAWDEDEGPLIWNDDEYEVMVEANPSRHIWRDDNVCKIIPFRLTGT